jgi:LysR family hydrogen peroxide-inducible transcriptional activator
MIQWDCLPWRTQSFHGQPGLFFATSAISVVKKAKANRIMELNQLRYFLKVAAVRSFTRAANDLGITQPAMSRAVAKLEAELGQPVFERQARSVLLTDAGELLRSRAEQILSIADNTVAELRDSDSRGSLRVGAIPTVAPYFLPVALSKFRDRFPDVQIIAFEETTEKLLQRCRDGEIDIAIAAAPISAKYVESEPLFEEELLAVLPPRHPLAKKSTILLSELREQPFVLLDETHCLSDAVLSFCKQRAFQPLAIQHTSQLATVEELVALGHGVSLIPQMARDIDRSARRVYRRVTNPIPTRTVMLVWNPYRFQSSRMARFRESLHQVAKSFAARPPRGRRWAITWLLIERGTAKMSQASTGDLTSARTNGIEGAKHVRVLIVTRFVASAAIASLLTPFRRNAAEEGRKSRAEGLEDSAAGRGDDQFRYQSSSIRTAPCIFQSRRSDSPLPARCGNRPESAMAYWGIAYANGPHINFPLVDGTKVAWSVKAREHA